MNWLDDLAPYRKFVVAIIGAAIMAVNEGLISGTAAKWVSIVIAVATALGVYVTPNEEEVTDDGN